MIQIKRLIFLPFYIKKEIQKRGKNGLINVLTADAADLADLR
jgi:hypothetical protein